MGVIIPEDSGRDVTTTADGDHQVRLELSENVFRSLLAQLVDLSKSRLVSACVLSSASPSPPSSLGLYTHRCR